MALRVTSDEYASLQRRLGVVSSDVMLVNKAKPPKFHNEQVTFDGVTFGSKGEFAHYCELKLKERAGLVSDVQCQVTFSLTVNNVFICDYRADFVYKEGPNLIVDDFKGLETDVFKLKEKLMLACYGATIRKSKAKKRRRK